MLKSDISAENEDLRQQRNEALAVCWAVEEWMDGRCTAEDVKETWRRVFDVEEPTP